MVRESEKTGFRRRPIFVVVVSTVLVLANAKLGFEASRLHSRIQARAQPTGGESEALRLIPGMESELRELEQRRKLLPATAPQSE